MGKCNTCRVVIRHAIMRSDEFAHYKSNAPTQERVGKKSNGDKTRNSNRVALDMARRIQGIFSLPLYHLFARKVVTQGMIWILYGSMLCWLHG